MKWVCSNSDFYDGICPAIIDHLYCDSRYPCKYKISEYEYEQDKQQILKAKTLLEKCGYVITKTEEKI